MTAAQTIDSSPPPTNWRSPCHCPPLPKTLTGFFHGTIDEIRVWTRPLLRTELAQRMYVPLAPAEHEALLLYFPLDDAGMEMGANAVESRALQWCAPRPARRLGPLAIVDASRLA